jgi:hypothetical protein
LQAQPKILKNHRNHKSTNQNENFPKKKYVKYLESVKEPKICIGATRRNLQAKPKMLKNIKSTNQNKKKSKKLRLVPQKCKRAKTSYGSYPTEFAGTTQKPKNKFQSTKYTNQIEYFPKKNYVSYLKSVKEP